MILLKISRNTFLFLAGIHYIAQSVESILRREI